MTPAELMGIVIACITIMGGFFAYVVGAVRDYTHKFDAVVNSVTEIRVALLGGLAGPGLVARMQDLEEGQVRMEDQLREIEMRLQAIEEDGA
jgi:hypothetical protein